ncbi:telomeric repeat-binding factor 1 [Salarias fasciatus]|uniref:Telomeric repeat-binding factor n=1 Tax=Salarias fasciatus TaxID=181472 RepID=A0A672JFM8_SALFA|nr:telomeric repeat-binding factor 1 [Salarias fasciatus]
MEEEEDKETLSGEVSLENVSFSQVSAVATGWMFDFMFVSLCRHFKEEKYEDFNELISTLQVVSKTPSLKRTIYQEKTLICAFLSRLIHGEHLDVQFEEDESVTPLMSAAQVWSSLKGAVADDSLFDNITVLLLVQSVAVCLKEGQRSSASSALKWFENNIECPQKLRDKLSKIVDQKDTYHPFLMSFSFSRLLETVQIFLDAFLEKNPSDYLLKAATETVQSSNRREELEDSELQKSSSTETTNGSHQKKKSTKRKLLPTKITDMWSPKSTKRLSVSVKRITPVEISRMKRNESVNNTSANKKRKSREKWTAELDKYLKDGVKRHGVGKWSRILMDYDFDGRTGTMLKDRWRILLKAHEVE